jgi:hypothetical protein
VLGTNSYWLLGPGLARSLIMDSLTVDKGTGFKSSYVWVRSQKGKNVKSLSSGRDCLCPKSIDW